MGNWKGILLAVGLAVLVIAACSIGGSALLDNSSHNLQSLAAVKAQENIRFMAGTIDKQSTALVASNIILGVVLVAVLIIGVFIIRALMKRNAYEPPTVNAEREFRGRWLDSGGAPKFLAFNPGTRTFIKRLPLAQKQALLDRLYTVISWLEEDVEPHRKGAALIRYEDTAPISWR